MSRTSAVEVSTHAVSPVFISFPSFFISDFKFFKDNNRATVKKEGEDDLYQSRISNESIISTEYDRWREGVCESYKISMGEEN
jgi:hypothetical protein